MSYYYLFIDGERYDGSLISNARFRVRGQNDNRISKADAQHLWRLALDGGRITEIEDQTLDYILENFNWTEAARQWFEEERAKPRPEISSYYKVIDGLRYDRRFLEKVEELTQGQGDGRISQEDAEFLVDSIIDFGDVTIEEERSIQYALENFRWTDQARGWFLDRVEPISNESSVVQAVPHVLKREYGLPGLQFEVNREELLKQQLELPNRLSFLDALRRQLRSLIEYDAEHSFRYMLQNVYGLESVVDPISDYIIDRIRAGIEMGKLIFYYEGADEEALGRDYGTPRWGEVLRENWILILELFDFTDDYFWILVPRDGTEDAYNYVDGPNFK